MEIIYILTNEAMPGYVKIGKTSTSLEQRIRELSSSTSAATLYLFLCLYGRKYEFCRASTTRRFRQ